MTLYYWRSNALANYGSGWIITEAANPDEARQQVRRDAENRWLEHHHHWYNPDDEDDRKDLANYLEEVMNDITVEPREAPPVLFIQGSE